MSVAFLVFRTEDTARFAQARAIRDAVFVREQSVPPEDEWDAYEEDALHVLMLEEGVAVGTARVRYLGNVAKLERIALVQAVRGKGYCALLLQHLLQMARSREGITEAKLSAQVRAIPFYEKAGFAVCSEEYLDAGIPHKMMQRVLE